MYQVKKLFGHGDGGYRIVDLTGQVFGLLMVKSAAGKNSWGRYQWLCKCECGKEKIACTKHLRQGAIRSCGCLKLGEGKTRTNPTYASWQAMMTRCYSPAFIHFNCYGGRGITVCQQWHSFKNFVSDMGKRPEGLTLERIENDKEYSPSNCKWATPKEQANNRQNNRHITFNGKTLTVAQWANLCGMKYSTLKERLKRWPIEKSLTQEVQYHAKH